jgi:histidyl-tRNA synthetase
MATSKITPRLPKGMRDFLPGDMLRRSYVFGLVQETFHRFGFEPLGTPTLELKETLYGKYGEDAEKLIYSAEHPGGKEEVAMRYDQTVPLARVVAQYENELKFPFKRYQLAPVFRAERPQKGRYREFFQCDADIVGVSGMIADAEIIALIAAVMQRLGFPQFSIKINNRKLLTAMGQYSGVSDSQLPDLYRSVDKFDKIGAEGVQKELLERGISAEATQRMVEMIQSRRPGLGNLDYAEGLMGSFPAATEGIRELRELAAYMADFGVPESAYEFDFTMVRGLGYYTGPIFETVITEPNLGSVNGGGRYDDLIGLFRKESMPTVGMSFGIERIIDLMDILKLYPAHLGGTVVQALVAVVNAETRAPSTRLTTELRAAGIQTELVMQEKGLGKQFDYANKKGIPLVIVAGPDELAQGVVKIKQLASGQEVTVARAAVVDTLKSLIG